MRVVVTGADGFVGWHTCVRLRALTEHDVVALPRERWEHVGEAVRGADAVIHLAGINRGDDAEVEHGNVALAHSLTDAVRASGGTPRLVYANSIQAGNGTPYGRGKAAAGEVLAQAAGSLGASFVDVRLPNLFGEHGLPRYNSFVATFVDAVNRKEPPKVVDRPVELLHVQGAAASLIDGLSGPSRTEQPAGTPTTVQGVLDTLLHFSELYDGGDIPPLMTALDVDLFNTLRAARFPGRYPIALTERADHRGRLVEVVRAHGGQGQTFVSTTRPGITRGEHFHLRKVERFVVLSGTARIALRRVLTDEVVSFDVSGDAPVVIDMPTMWVHNITNTGADELTTLFWTHELFDPAAPDTFAEAVRPTLSTDDQGRDH